MWKYCWYSKWSKQCCRQTLDIFMRWYWNLGRLGPQIHLLCCWAPQCNSGNFKQETSEQILAVCCRDHGPWDTEGAARSLYIISLCLQPQLWCKCTFRLVYAPRNHIDKSRYAITFSNFSTISQMHGILNMFKAWTRVTKLWQLDISCMSGLWQRCQNGQVLKKAPFFHHLFHSERESIIPQKDLTPTTKSSPQQNLPMNMAVGIHLSWQPQERSWSNFLSYDILHKKEHIYY